MTPKTKTKTRVFRSFSEKGLPAFVFNSLARFALIAAITPAKEKEKLTVL